MYKRSSYKFSCLDNMKTQNELTELNVRIMTSYNLHFCTLHSARANCRKQKVTFEL